MELFTDDNYEANFEFNLVSSDYIFFFKKNVYIFSQIILQKCKKIKRKKASQTRIITLFFLPHLICKQIFLLALYGYLFAMRKFSETRAGIIRSNHRFQQFFFIYKINNQTNLSPNYSNFVDCEIHLLYINSTITECSSSFFFLVKKVIMKQIARTINIVRISYLLVTFISISISRVLQIVDHIGRFFSLLFKN